MMIDVIINPTAGHGRGKTVGLRIEEKLCRLGIAHRIHLTSHPFHATELAREAARNGAQSVLSVGGDGTAFETACGLINTDTALGIIPAGTGNDFIKSLNAPRDPLHALDFVLSHPPRSVDVGRLNDRLFLNCCGVGFDVVVLEHSLTAKKYTRGLLPYLYGVFKAIFLYKPVPITYTLDNGEEVNESVLLFSIANGKFFGGGIPIAPAARVDDGIFDVIVVKTVKRWQIPFYLPGLMMGKIDSLKPARHLKCRKVRLQSHEMHLNVDGEILALSEATFSNINNAIRLHW